MSCYSQSHFDCSNLFTCSFTGFHSLQRLTAIVVIRNSHILYYRSLSKVTGVTRGLHWTTVTCVGIETPGGTEVNVCTGVINRQNMLGVCVYVLQFFSSVLPGIVNSLPNRSCKQFELIHICWHRLARIIFYLCLELCRLQNIPVSQFMNKQELVVHWFLTMTYNYSVLATQNVLGLYLYRLCCSNPCRSKLDWLSEFPVVLWL